MDEEFRPEHQASIDLLERFTVVGRQFDAFPHLGGEVGAFNGFHVQIKDSGFRGGANGGVAGIGERAGLPVAEACDVVFISAEVLLFGDSVGRGQ